MRELRGDSTVGYSLHASVAEPDDMLFVARRTRFGAQSGEKAPELRMRHASNCLYLVKVPSSFLWE